ncbi:MAG: ECF RNA polymerase sigma factor SigW [Verrucomicrobiae bacterium]|nr:ECF RNA polymerase sigma factor SigW [Verrucomicrobiae bacterium]
MELHEQSDSQLIVRLQADAEPALDELMRRYKHPVINFCYRLLGNATDADDIAQETFVRLYQNRAKLDPAKKLTTWLFAVARNLCLDRLRYRHRHPTEPLDTAPDHIAPATVDKELGEQIAAAVAQLPEDQRTALILAEYHGQSYAEIAAVLKSTEKSVESRLYRAKQTLREKLRRLGLLE